MSPEDTMKTQVMIAALICVAAAFAASPEAHKLCSETPFQVVAADYVYDGTSWSNEAGHNPIFEINVTGDGQEQQFSTNLRLPEVIVIPKNGDPQTILFPTREGTITGDNTEVVFCMSHLNGGLRQLLPWERFHKVTTTSTPPPPPPPPPVLCDVPGTNPYEPCPKVCPE